MAPIIISIRGYLPGYMQSDEFTNVVSLVNFTAYAVLCGALLFVTRDIFKQDFKKIDSWGKFCKKMGLGLLFTFGAALVGNTLVRLVFGVNDVAANQAMVESALGAMPILMLITVTFLGPIVEEIIFRLVLMSHFNLKPIHNLIFSSLIFGLVHVLVGGLVHIIPYFLMGLVLGYFYLKNNNIWHATVLHILHNGVTVLLVFWAQRMLEMYQG
jgi:membrane protease YdiL (CAAX protease family)